MNENGNRPVLLARSESRVGVTGLRRVARVSDLIGRAFLFRPFSNINHGASTKQIHAKIASLRKAPYPILRFLSAVTCFCR